jgi:hypothetical protein
MKYIKLYPDRGVLKYDYNNEIIHVNLQKLYSRTGDRWKVGRHNLFKLNLTFKEKEEVLFFKNCLENSSINILKAALPKNYS